MISWIIKSLPILFVLIHHKKSVKAKSNQGIYYRELGYILKTGANWAKPIADFTLTIERPKDQIVSFCWKGKGEVKKSTAK